MLKADSVRNLSGLRPADLDPWPMQAPVLQHAAECTAMHISKTDMLSLHVTVLGERVPTTSCCISAAAVDIYQNTIAKLMLLTYHCYSLTHS